MREPHSDRNTHLVFCGAVQVVEEDGTPPVHPVDALPDTDASAGLLITFILEQQAWKEQRGETDGLYRKAVIQQKAFRYIIGFKRRFWLDSWA